MDGKIRIINKTFNYALVKREGQKLMVECSDYEKYNSNIWVFDQLYISEVNNYVYRLTNVEYKVVLDLDTKDNDIILRPSKDCIGNQHFHWMKQDNGTIIYLKSALEAKKITNASNVKFLYVKPGFQVGIDCDKLNTKESPGDNYTWSFQHII